MRNKFAWGISIAIAALTVYLLAVVTRMERIESAVHVLTETDGIKAVITTSAGTETLNAAQIGDTYWLFLPGCVEGENLTADGNGAGTVTNDRTVTLHDPLNRTVHILTGSTQPCLFLTTEHDISYVQNDETKETADEGKAMLLTAEGAIAYNGTLEDIHGRGNASWDQDKKGYSIELEGEAEIPGLSYVGEHYALVAHSDTSYVRNRISQQITRTAGGLALDYVLVDLYINGDYQGLYELHEKVTAETLGLTDLATSNKMANKGRSELTMETTGVTSNDWNQSVTGKWWSYENDPADVSGGYIIEANDANRYEEKESGFITTTGVYFTMKSPSKLTHGEYDFISSYTQLVENEMLAAVGSDSYENLSALIDVPSFEAKYLVEEISKNIDSCVTSQFFYKDAGGILYAGPVWDHDWAYGVERVQGDVDYSDPEGFSANQITGSLTWYQLLYYNQAFQNEIKALYRDTVSPRVQEIASEEIATWQQTCEQSAVMDLILWNAYDSDDPDTVRKAYYADGAAVAEFLQERDCFLLSQWSE